MSYDFETDQLILCHTMQPTISLCAPLHPVAVGRQPSGQGGPFLGLEPGLGITTPLLDHHHKRDKTAAATAEGSYAGTPSSVAASDAARPFGAVPPSPLAGGGSSAASPAAAAAEAAAAIAAARAAAAVEAEKKQELKWKQMQNSILYGELIWFEPGLLTCRRGLCERLCTAQSASMH